MIHNVLNIKTNLGLVGEGSSSWFGGPREVSPGPQQGSLGAPVAWPYLQRLPKKSIFRRVFAAQSQENDGISREC